MDFSSLRGMIRRRDGCSDQIEDPFSFTQERETPLSAEHLLPSVPFSRCDTPLGFHIGSGHVTTRVLILTGPPGSGKTTVAEILATMFERTVHLQADLFFHAIRSGFVEPWKAESKRQNETVMRAVTGSAATFAKDGYFTVIDGILLPAWFLHPVHDALTNEGLSVAVAILRAPSSVCLERVRVRPTEPSRDPDVITQLWRGFDEVGELERCVIDSDDVDARATAQRVIDRLQSGALTIA
jgi:tRNA uridine 5-carbamoylmethylation protein Kti12